SFLSLIRPPPTSYLFPYTTLFRSLKIFAAIIDGLPARIVHSQFVRPTHPGHVAGPAEFHFGRFPSDHEARRGENIFPYIPNRFLDRKSTRLNSSHEWISYAVFCLK